MAQTAKNILSAMTLLLTFGVLKHPRQSRATYVAPILAVDCRHPISTSVPDSPATHAVTNGMHVCCTFHPFLLMAVTE